MTKKKKNDLRRDLYKKICNVFSISTKGKGDIEQVSFKSINGKQWLVPSGDIAEGSTIISIPLSSCLYKLKKTEEIHDDDSEEEEEEEEEDLDYLYDAWKFIFSSSGNDNLTKEWRHLYQLAAEESSNINCLSWPENLVKPATAASSSLMLCVEEIQTLVGSFKDKESLEVDFKSFVSTMINKAYKMYPLNEYVILPIFPWIQTSFPAGKDINSILSLDEDGASLSIVAAKQMAKGEVIVIESPVESDYEAIAGGYPSTFVKKSQSSSDNSSSLCIPLLLPADILEYCISNKCVQPQEKIHVLAEMELLDEYFPVDEVPPYFSPSLIYLLRIMWMDEEEWRTYEAISMDAEDELNEMEQSDQEDEKEDANEDRRRNRTKEEKVAKKSPGKKRRKVQGLSKSTESKSEGEDSSSEEQSGDIDADEDMTDNYIIEPGNNEAQVQATLKAIIEKKISLCNEFLNDQSTSSDSKLDTIVKALKFVVNGEKEILSKVKFE